MGITFINWLSLNKYMACLCKLQKYPLGYSMKNGVLKELAKLQPPFRLTTSLEKRLQHRCFPVYFAFAKVLKKTFSQNAFGNCL